MSYKGPTGRSFSGRTKTRGSAGKNVKRKKQEFHQHRVKGLGPETPDMEQLKSRTILALDHLGHQVLSDLPGGYDLKSWTEHLNDLLDDFEERFGREKLPAAFSAAREEALGLVRPVDLSSIDSEIGRLENEMAEASRRLAEERERIGSRLKQVKVEQEAFTKELQSRKGELADVVKESRSRGFFSRLLSGAPPTAPVEAKISEVEAKIGSLVEEAAKLRESMAALKAPAGAADPTEALEKLQSERTERQQLAKERQLATKSIADVVGAIEVKPRAEDGQPSS